MAEMKPTPGSTPNPSPAAPATGKFALLCLSLSGTPRNTSRVISKSPLNSFIFATLKLLVLWLTRILVKAGLNGGLSRSRYGPNASTNAGNEAKDSNKTKSRYKNANYSDQQNQGRGQNLARNNDKCRNNRNQKHQGSDSIQRASGHTGLGKAPQAPIHQNQVPSPKNESGQTKNSGQTAIQGAPSQGPLIDPQPSRKLVSFELHTTSQSIPNHSFYRPRFWRT